MNLYRCKFLLVDYNNLESNIFIRSLDEETAKNNAKKIYENTLQSRGIAKSKYVQIVTLSSDQELLEYQSNMKKRNNSDKSLN